MIVIALGACDQAIEMKLTSPVAGADIDTSCVTAVELTIRGEGAFDEVTSCIEVEAGRVRSLRNHGLSGLFDEPLPTWRISTVQVRGVAALGGCTEKRAVGPTIFVASTDEAGGDTINLPLRGVVSCADRVETPTVVRAIDLGALIADGSCVGTQGLLVQPGEIFPSELYGADSGWMHYLWSQPLEVGVDGLVTLPSIFTSAVTGSCVSMLGDDGLEYVDGCVTPAGRGACGPEPEFHYLPVSGVASASLTTEEIISRTVVVFGVVIDRARAPIAGATITTTNADAVVQYTNPQGAGFAAAGGTGTTAAGTFTVLSNQPVLLEINAPGKATRRVMGSGYGATLVVMDDGTP